MPRSIVLKASFHPFQVQSYYFVLQNEAEQKKSRSVMEDPLLFDKNQ